MQSLNKIRYLDEIISVVKGGKLDILGHRAKYWKISRREIKSGKKLKRKDWVCGDTKDWRCLIHQSI
jgi:hypothetical protein